MEILTLTQSIEQVVGLVLMFSETHLNGIFTGLMSFGIHRVTLIHLVKVLNTKPLI